MEASAAAGFYARKLRAEDLLECLMVQTGRLGDELVGRERAVEIWRKLLHSPLCSSTVIESPCPFNGKRIVGFGFDAAVSRTFADEEIANPRPGMNARILASIDAGEPVILSRKEIAAGNAKGGIDLVILYGSCVAGMNPVQISEMGGVMAPAYLAARSGYRIQRILTETVGVEEEMHFEATHTFRVVKRFDANRCLRVTVRPEEELTVTASFSSPLFHYRPPVLRLHESEKELLIAALAGLTDEELSNELGLTLTAVKKRWASTFERTVLARPDLFPSDNEPDGEKRGRQKRHHVLAYVRAHPEELRPYDGDAR